MHKILFTTPPLSREKRYGSLAGGGSSSPSLGLLMLAAVARQRGFTCTVIDASALELTEQELLQRISTLNPDVIGISSTTLAISSAGALAAASKSLFPAVTTLIGGPHATAVPRETLLRYPALDIAVTGEGEETIGELLEVLQNGTPLASVAGIVYRNGVELNATGRRPLITNLDSLPFPAWDLLEGFPERYLPAPFKVRNLPAAILVTSRGCPNSCIFCDRSVFGSSCHAFSAEYIVRQMTELHQRYGIREFSFEDDTFITFKRRLVEICSRLIALKMDISWTCLGRVNHITPENLALMRRAGCWQISFGVESGSQDILNLVNKGITLDQIRDAVQLTRKAGIKAKGFFIAGHPRETRETLRMTLDFALTLPLNDISVSLMTPFPGSELYDRASEFGTFDADWENMNLLNAIFVPYGLTREELELAQKKMLRCFYLRPRIIADYLMRIVQNPRLTKGVWSGFISLLRNMAA
jgi:radical SAM superfamily enzyme YgiQ (UPF0313 family)